MMIKAGTHTKNLWLNLVYVRSIALAMQGIKVFVKSFERKLGLCYLKNKPATMNVFNFNIGVIF